MTEYLGLEDVLGIAAIAIGALPAVRDIGLLDSACHRPAAQAWGDDAYPDPLSKAAALLQSLTNNHALIDGNKRTAWLATVVFLRLNGATVTAVDGYDSDPARMVLAVATGDLRDVPTIRAALREMVSSGP
ncbi:MAG: type II toxin-antitoxin system death-on-curing family toxin [Nakamurella sp.]